MSARPEHENKPLQSLLEIKVSKLLTPLESFICRQTTAAILLAIATIIALIIYNTPLSDYAQHITHYNAGFVLDNWQLQMPLKEWVSSGLMVFFFFLIGLELKREVLAGRLKHPKQISLIILAAFGGMIVPAVIYLILNIHGDGANGWAIPMATDTAFAMGVLALMARKVSYGISIFLTALAIFDDIGAIIIISFFYSSDIHVDYLIYSALVIILLLGLNILGIRKGWIYVSFGIVLWALIYHSGVHATLAGLLLAAVIPARAQIGQIHFLDKTRLLLLNIEEHHSNRSSSGADKEILAAQDQHDITTRMEETIRAVSTPLQRWETVLIYPVGIGVLPIFALFNAGVSLSLADLAQALSHPVTQGIILGLVIGKPIGIGLFVYLGKLLNIGKLPEGMSFAEVIGAGLLGGIGFTMSLFVTTLSFGDSSALTDAAKTGIILASLLSAGLASLWLSVTHMKQKRIFQQKLIEAKH